MRRFLFALMLLVGFVAPGLIWADVDYSTAQWVPGHLIVSFTSRIGYDLADYDGQGAVVKTGESSVDELLDRYKVTRMTRLVDDKILGMLDFPPDFYRTMVLSCSESTDVLRMLSEFQKNPDIEWAEPDLMRPLEQRIPNDPLWSNQWDKRMMHCPETWDYSTGSRDIIVAAVDGGVWWKHSDFRANLWVNPGEDLNNDSVAYTDTTYPGDQADADGLDTDGDGKIDDLIGWDFITTAPGCGPGEDCDGNQDNNSVGTGEHGTHVTGIMGAVGNNGVGVSGVNWNVKIMAVRAGYTDNQGNGYILQNASIPCMLWAVGKGARVINMSYGSASQSPAEANAITSCWNQGAIMVAAAGNETSSAPHYPAANAHVVSVGALDVNSHVSSYSNYGTWVRLFAPGGDDNGQIMSTVIPGYAGLMGTSMASPNAAGVFALLWSLFPTYTNQEMVELVYAHCADLTALNPGFDPSYLGNGRIDAMLPVAAVRPNLTLGNTHLFGDTDGDGRLESGESASMTIEVHNDSAWSAATNVQVTITTDDPNIALSNATFPLGTISPGTTEANTTAPFTISIPGTLAESHWATLTANITADDFSAQRTFVLELGKPQTLIIEDDGTSSFHSYFISSMIGQGYSYNNDVYSTQSGDVTANLLADYQIVVWVCGNENTNTVTASDQAILTSWLNTGGKNLLLAGQGIDQDISSSSFYSDALHCQTANVIGNRNLDGVGGDPISDGTTLLLLGGGCGNNGNVHPSKIIPTAGGVGIYDYDSSGVRIGTGAVRFSNDTYKVAYFAFAIEAACGAGGTTHHSVVIRNVMQWFGAHPSDAEPHQASTLPAGYSLKANYPNPFNPTTTLAFELPRATRVYLTIYDMLGRQVAVLARGTMAAGAHTVTFDGSDLASGTYLAHLQAENYSATQKMLLLK